ncbi:class I SAM-dependent methyltransferase [Variovorax sp. J22P168]|uniref:class I SAM-dependent methyltransferase n=1 Tax=Variovorax jilinensis TaxID=3053513 RepID=UPI002578609A|nr:class I SAM-dependent methyltransferase [Variovorax sp. J22P168]MDM0014887.1 class I SAM-dependent methyltransferase [Variovorax sp. J22P168]
MTSSIIESPAAEAPDYAAIKQRQQATWASGDYTVVGTTLQIVGETLAEAVDLRAGERVLDVAAGNGNATLAAARRYAEVTSTDYVQALLDRGRARAEAEGLTVSFQLADAEALPFDGASFDCVLSVFGVMFAPDQARAAQELLRVVRPGGRIGMANWTPNGFIGRLFKIIGAHVPPPAGVRPPSLWGTEAQLVQWFGPRALTLKVEHRYFAFRYRSAAHFVQVFRDFYGPTHKAFGALDAAGQAALERDITALIDELDIGGGRGLVVPSEYAEIVITVS